MLHVAFGAHTPIVCAMFMSQEISQLSMAQGHVTQIKRQSHQPQKKRDENNQVSDKHQHDAKIKSFQDALASLSHCRTR